MKKAIILFSAILFVNHTYGQSKDSLSTPNFHKNEIGLIANPIGIVLLGAEPYGQRIGISYKRNFKKPHVFLTSGLYYQGYNNKYSNRNELTLEVNGLLRNIQYNRESANKIIAGFGIEKRKNLSQCPVIVAYYGIEFQFAYGETNNTVGNQWMETDSTNIIENNPYSVKPISEFTQTKLVNKTTIGGGFQINAGLQLHLNKRIYLFAQTAPSFLISNTTRKENDYISKTTSTFKSSQFDFDMRALVSDIGLCFRF
ncbi:MAG TPA: hypothetical protein PK323_01125 [Bacteroidia bacterium]|nr:hypothetical protein [Bacteroidia bacterium]